MFVEPQRLKATQMLIVATALWGLSFATMKALMMVQDGLLPGRSNWFFASLCIVYRFGAASLVILALCAHTLRRLTRLEWEQGLGLGLFGGLGLLLQMDALKYTEASTSAFLTQCYCVILPVWVSVRDRRWPSLQVVLGSLLVIAGVAVLARADFRDFHLRRGELETILASVVFTGQILWLDRPGYAANNVHHFTLVMFATTALVCLPVAVLTTQQAADWVTAYSAPSTLAFQVILVFGCAVGAFLLMNRWQRHVGATLAGLIYCIEPVFASVYALFLPGWLSAMAGVNYANETVTTSLLWGGGLITVANVLVQWPGGREPALTEPEKAPPTVSRESAVSAEPET